MRFGCKTLFLIASLAACSLTSNQQTYSVYFQQYSTDLDPQARQTVLEAAVFARDRAFLPVQVVGYAAPAVPTRAVPAQELDALSAQRAQAVKQMLVDNGIGPNRITVVANGATDPKPLPSISVRRVDISFGPQPVTKSAVAAPGFR